MALLVFVHESVGLADHVFEIEGEVHHVLGDADTGHYFEGQGLALRVGGNVCVNSRAYVFDVRSKPGVAYYGAGKFVSAVSCGDAVSADECREGSCYSLDCDVAVLMAVVVVYGLQVIHVYGEKRENLAVVLIVPEEFLKFREEAAAVVKACKVVLLGDIGDGISGRYELAVVQNRVEH